MSRHSDPAQSLLMHRDFVRRLAAAVVGADADDLAQEVWATVLQRPPRHQRAVRQWLKATLHHLFLNQRKAAVRRAAREAAASAVAAAPVPSAAEIVAREETRRRVVAAVTSLPTPLREVVLLRYYEELDSKAIGVRLGRPAGTVRWQLRQALQQLRHALDEGDGGRSAWLPPMAWWQQARHGNFAALLRVNWPLGIGAATVLVAALALVLLPGVAPPAQVPTLADAATSLLPHSAAGDQHAPPAGMERTAAAPVSTAQSASERPRGNLRGTVITDLLHEPVASATVVVHALRRSFPAGFQASEPAVERTGVSAADGSFAFDDLPGGGYEVIASSAGGGRATASVGIGAGTSTVALAMAAADPGQGLLVVKVVDRNRLPVAGAEVKVAAVNSDGTIFGWRSGPALGGKTGRDGVLRIADARLGKLDKVLVRVQQQARVAFGRRYDWCPYVEVCLDAPGVLAGTLDGLPGRDWRGSTVALYASLGGIAPDLDWARFTARPSADGSFRIEHLPAGDYQLRLDADGAALVVPPRDPTLRLSEPLVDIAAGTTSTKTFAVDATARLRGRALTADGTPVRGAVITARLRWPHDAADIYRHADYLDAGDRAVREQLTSDLTQATTSTDETGRYELGRLPPGEYDLLVSRPGLGMQALPCVSVDAGTPIDLEHRLVRGGAIRGISPRSWIGIRARGAAPCKHLLFASDGGFELAGLAPGVYEIDRCDGTGKALRPAQTIDVVAGEATWVDLRSVACIVEGSLFSAGEPLSGLEVHAGRDNDVVGVTGSDGHFRVAVGDQVQDDRLDLRFTCRGVQVGSSAAQGPFADVHRLGALELPARRVELRVLDASGQPADAMIAIDGVPLRVAAGVLRDQWLAVGEHTVADRCRDQSACDQTLTTETVVMVPAAGEIAPIVIRRRPSATARVRVVDADGASMPFARVQAIEWSGQGAAPVDPTAFVAASRGARSGICLTDRDGVARLAGFAAGPVLLYVQGLPRCRAPSPHEFVYGKALPWQASPPPAGQIVTVRAGETAEVSLQLRR